MNQKPKPQSELWNDTWKNVKNIEVCYANRGIFNVWLGTILNILNNRFHIYLPLTFLDKWGGLLLAIGQKKSSDANGKLTIERCKHYE